MGSKFGNAGAGAEAGDAGRIVRIVARDVGALLPTPSGSIALLEAVPLPFPWTTLCAFAPEALVFASRNAVEAFARALDGAPQPRSAWDWRRARLAAVGAVTARAAATRLAEEGFSTGEVLAPPGDDVGLRPLLELLAARAAAQGLPSPRVAVLGARGGRAHDLEAPREGIAPGDTGSPRILLPVDCYVLVPSERGARAATDEVRAGPVAFEVGSGALAHALLDALENEGLLDPPPPGVKFLPRHASARMAIEGRLPASGASIGTLPPAK